MSDAAARHPMAPEHLPYFIPAADGSDPMFYHAVGFVILLLFLGGVFYLYLHSIPERMAHGGNRAQFQIVAILGLVALFTHENIFWIVALLLAALQLPDFLTPITSSARSLARMVRRDYEGDVQEDVPVAGSHGGLARTDREAH